MSETQTSAVEYQTHPAHLEKAVQEMLDLRWPEYTDETQHLETMAERIEAVAAANDSVLDDYYSDSAQATNVNGFYLSNLSAMRDIQNWDAMDPREIRETAAEFHAQKCRELTTLLANGPFAACNPAVAEAFRKSMDEVIATLTSALSRQEDGASKYDHDIHDYDAGLTLQVLEYTLAGTAVQLGAVDHHEAMRTTPPKPIMECYTGRGKHAQAGKKIPTVLDT